LKIALICGGISPEREVSLASGKKITQALRQRGHTVAVIDPAAGHDQPDEDELFSFSIKSEPPSKNGIRSEGSRKYLDAVNIAVPDDTEAVFIALHGTWGEDGRIQALLEFRGIPYTGSGVLASALAMDKIVTKKLFHDAGVPTPVWTSIAVADPDINALKGRINEKFGYPAVVKPPDQGSTVGLTIVSNESDLEHAVDVAFRFSGNVLVESYIPGRELTVSILEGRALPIIEIRPKQGFYDYHNKYTPGRTDYLVPAPVDEEFGKRLQAIAVHAFSVLGCKGFGRVDFRYNDAGQVFCLEVNTIPGMTDTSLVPKAALADGISYEDLCERIVLDSLSCK
jgi:D-alanine-D-alanine ligase